MEKINKVGILTFSYSANVGSVMQAFALQKTISSFEGFEASIINYTKTKYGKPIIGKDVFPRSIRSWSPKNVIMWCIKIAAHYYKMRKFNKFFAKYYNDYSDHYYERGELESLNDAFDKFVVGSDQVWNFDSPQVDETYFLDFVKDGSKKISYAASFGKSNVPEDKREQVARFISDFYAISVREPEGVDIVSDLTAKKAEWVLDPSLLLSKEEYHKFSRAPKKKGYVYLYLRQESERLEDFAERLAKARNLKVVKVINNWVCGKNGKRRSPIGPEEWLGYVEHADYIVTNSFHGICFSTIFEKEFYIDFLEKTSIVTNSRLEGMLKQFDFKNRCIDEVTDLLNLPRVDYSAVNEIKQKRINESLDYLKRALEGEI